MLSLVLVSALNLAPGITLADNVGSRSADLGARIRFVRDDDDKRPSLDAMTREQLARELKRLEETMPSFGGPIAAMAVGFPLGIAGAVMVYFGVAMFEGASSAVLAGAALVVFGGAMVITGFIIALIGSIKLATRFGARAAHREQIDEVQQKIDAIDQAPVNTPLPPPDEAPPPPPPLPPEANLVRPGPMITVMTF